jgi:hypothetical protein
MYMLIHVLVKIVVVLLFYGVVMHAVAKFDVVGEPYLVLIQLVASLWCWPIELLSFHCLITIVVINLVVCCVVLHSIPRIAMLSACNGERVCGTNIRAALRCQHH